MHLSGSKLYKTKAKQGGITVSEYLRTLGVSGKIVMQIKAIPQILEAYSSNKSSWCIAQPDSKKTKFKR